MSDTYTSAVHRRHQPAHPEDERDPEDPYAEENPYEIVHRLRILANAWRRLSHDPALGLGHLRHPANQLDDTLDEIVTGAPQEESRDA